MRIVGSTPNEGGPLKGAARKIVRFLRAMASALRRTPKSHRNPTWSIIVSGRQSGVFENDFMELSLGTDGISISLSLKNKSSDHLRILWDESSFVDPDGNSTGLLHSGAQISSKNESQKPSVVPSRSSLEATVFPMKNIVQNELKKTIDALSTLPSEWNPLSGAAVNSQAFVRVPEWICLPIIGDRKADQCRLVLAIETKSSVRRTDIDMLVRYI